MSSSKKLLQSASGFIDQSGSLNVEDVFSIDTFFDSNNSADDAGRTITNGIDLAGEGGLVWVKSRTSVQSHSLTDTVRGASVRLGVDTTAANATGSKYDKVDQFNNNGFRYPNGFVTAQDYVAWTFRKAPKFFDLKSWSGNGTAGRQISHDLDADVGMIIIKATNISQNWFVWHKDLNTNQWLALSENYGLATTGTHTYLNNTNPTSSVITLGSDNVVNGNGNTYIGYFFAHDTSDEGMIQCGTYVGNGSATAGPHINLGFEPQWLLVKSTADSTNWSISDTMRGLHHGNEINLIYPHLDNAEASISTTPSQVAPTSTGFQVNATGTNFNTNSAYYLYLAIRKAPMATPTTRASVFDLELGGSSVADNGLTINTGFPVDLAMFRDNYASGGTNAIKDRLRGNKVLATELANPQQGGSTYQSFDSNDGLINKAGGSAGNLSGGIYYAWRRAPKFFDVVTYDGNGSNRTINHNLGVVPDMIWIKIRSSTGGYTRGWVVTSLHLPNATATNDTTLYLNTNAAEVDEAIMNDTAPTSTVFSVGTDAFVNNSSSSYVAYLFANLAGISKVGTFSHTNGSSTDVDCGFSSGSMMVIVKRTDSTGDWYHWDSVRGIVSGNDPYLLLNTNATQVTNTDYIDPLNSGFQMSSSFTTGDYIFYAIAS